MNRLLALWILICLSCLTGCALIQMPLSQENAKLDATKPLFLMSVVVKNEFRPLFKPRVYSLAVKPEAAPGLSQTMVPLMDQKGVIVADTDAGETVHLVRFTTGSAPHRLRYIHSVGMFFPISASYFLNLSAPIPARQGGVHYLGAVRAVIRERRDGEFRAGPVIPLIDQAVAGASSGTFDVEIVDHYDSDMALFRKTFPALEGVEIQKAILAPWDRAKVQRAFDNGEGF